MSEKKEPKRIRKKLGVDGLVIVLAALIFAATVFLIFEDGYLFPENGQVTRTPVGKFSNRRNDVRRRLDTGLTWSSVNVSDTVYEGDSIFTGDESQAIVSFDKGGDLNIDPKSLVVIRTKGDQLEVDLQYGSLLGKMNDQTPLILTQDGQRQELRSSNAEVRIVRNESGKATRVQVVRGELTVRSLPADGMSSKGGAKKVIRENEFLDLKGGDPSSPGDAIRLVSPAPDSVLWLEPGKKVSLKWKLPGGETSAKKQTQVLELANEPGFGKPFFKSLVKGTSFVLSEDSLPDGEFYWRVRSAGKKQKNAPRASAPSKLTVYKDIPPRLVSPLESAVISFDPEAGETGQLVELSWSDSSGSQEFEVEVARDPEFKELVHKRRLKAMSESTPLLEPGSYYWRAMGIHSLRSNPPWSGPQSFVVKEGPRTPMAPKLASTELAYQIPVKLLKNLTPGLIRSGRGLRADALDPFAWEQVEFAEGYEIELALDSEFKKSIKRSIGPNTKFAPKEVRPGRTVYFRVRALGSEGLISPPSETARLRVLMPPPRLGDVEPVVQKFPTDEALKKGKHVFEIKWPQQPFVASYELEWSPTPDFSPSKKTQTKKALGTLPVTESVDYHVRARSLAPDGSPMSVFSKPKIISYRKELAPPPVPVLASKKSPTKAPASVSKGQLGGLAAKAILPPKLREPRPNTKLISLEGSPVYVNFKWKEVPDAEFYTLQISADPGFSSLIGESKVRKNTFVSERVLPEGSIYWRVRSHKKKDVSDWSERFDLNVMYE